MYKRPSSSWTIEEEGTSRWFKVPIMLEKLDSYKKWENIIWKSIIALSKYRFVFNDFLGISILYNIKQDNYYIIE